LSAVRDALQEFAAEERAGFARADVLKFYEELLKRDKVNLDIFW
jgi:hypothetical protein